MMQIAFNPTYSALFIFVYFCTYGSFKDKDMETYATVLTYAIPGFIGLIIVESIAARMMGVQINKGMDTISSLSSGMTNTMKSLLGLSVVILSYEWMVEHWGDPGDQIDGLGLCPRFHWARFCRLLVSPLQSQNQRILEPACNPPQQRGIQFVLCFAPNHFLLRRCLFFPVHSYGYHWHSRQCGCLIGPFTLVFPVLVPHPYHQQNGLVGVHSGDSFPSPGPPRHQPRIHR